MGRIKPTDRIWCMQGEEYVTESRYNCDIIIPQTIDQDNPKRGLLGMLDKERWKIISNETLDGLIVWDWNVPEISFEATPTLAILKALKEQIGGK